MTKDAPPRPIGMRHSLLYAERGERIFDSRKARTRLASFLYSHNTADEDKRLSARLRTELGSEALRYQDFFASCSTAEFLDSITVVSAALDPGKRGAFLKFVERVFDEERLAYEIDEGGGVHPLVDAEFARHMEATLAVLSAPRYRAVLAHFEKSMEHFGGTSPDGKAAVRDLFLAAETLFKLVAPGTPQRLGKAEIEQFRAFAVAKIGGDRTAELVTGKLISAFVHWVEGAHFYRHGQKEEEVSEPPNPLVVLLMNQGAGYIRWLAGLG